MAKGDSRFLDLKVRDTYTTYGNIDEADVKILEGLSLLGPRNLALIAKHLEMPSTTLRYRVNRMLEDSLLFLHLNPYHTNLGLKKAVVFVEAIPGYEGLLRECLLVNDFWLYMCGVYGPYDGWGGIWAIPEGNDEDFEEFLQSLSDIGVAESFEINWTTCHEGIPVKSRWFSVEENRWVFNWDEWINEVESIDGELPFTLKEPDDWPIKADYIDLLIIKELEKDGRISLTDISEKIGVSLETVKYHFREHVSKRDLIEDYQVEIFRFLPFSSESLFFKFEFNSYDKFARFALSLKDKPFPTFLGKVLGKNELVSHINLPKKEFRKFKDALSELIRMGQLARYRYVIQDMYVQWRETIPYEHFEDGGWVYDAERQREELVDIIKKSDFLRQ